MDINTFFEQRFWELSKELSTKEIFVPSNLMKMNSSQISISISYCSNEKILSALIS